MANICFLCGEDEESIEHILIHCPMARELWSILFSMFDVDWVIPYLIRDFILGWHGAILRKRHKKVWVTAPLVCFGHFGMRKIRLSSLIKSFQS